MTHAEEQDYIKAAYQALIDRGVITADMLSPSTVTDEMLDSFEQEFEVKLPSLLRTYLKTYCHNINALFAPVPMDDISMADSDVARQIQSASVEDILALDEEELPYLEMWWCGIFPIPQDDPLKYYRDAMAGFRVIVDYPEDSELTENDIKQFIPFADWQGAGMLCIDTTKSDAALTADEPDTWQVCWFDHEEFDWNQAEYINENGVVTGDKIVPDFQSFLRLYFFGIYDELYCRWTEEDGEEVPDKREWCEVEG